MTGGEELVVEVTRRDRGRFVPLSDLQSWQVKAVPCPPKKGNTARVMLKA